MGLEAGTTISQLDSTWPVGASDQVAQGDDHLRLIKSVLKTQFPGAAGLGFNIPITAKETDINALAARGAFFVSKNTQQVITAADQLITWQVETLDNENGFASNQYIVPADSAGLWVLFVLTVGLSSANINVNGINVLVVGIGSGTVASPIVLAGGDIVKVTSTSSSVGTIDAPGATGSYFCGFKVI